jgi:hypothetical protein
VGVWSRIARREPALPVLEAVPIPSPAEASPVFAVDIDSGVLYGVPTLDDWIFNRMRISRAEALRIPAVKRARDLICGGIGQFVLKLYDPNGRERPWSLLDQPEIGVARSVSMTRLVEDLLLSQRGWWLINNLAWNGYPYDVRRLLPETVPVQPELVQSRYGTAQVWPDINGLIRFDSPNTGLLEASNAIKACVALERAALNAADGAPPVDWFTPTDGPDPDPEDVKKFLADWRESRRNGSTGFIPSWLDYKSDGFDPLKLQLAEARTFAITEIARLTGVDAEELSISTTSRTYANMQDRRRAFIDSVLGPYMTAIEGRISMDDLTPHGFTASFDTSSFLRLDDLSAAQADVALVNAGILGKDEARAKRGLDPTAIPEPPAAPALPAPTQEPVNAAS